MGFSIVNKHQRLPFCVVQNDQFRLKRFVWFAMVYVAILLFLRKIRSLLGNMLLRGPSAVLFRLRRSGIPLSRSFIASQLYCYAVLFRLRRSFIASQLYCFAVLFRLRRSFIASQFYCYAVLLLRSFIATQFYSACGGVLLLRSFIPTLSEFYCFAVVLLRSFIPPAAEVLVNLS